MTSERPWGQLMPGSQSSRKSYENKIQLALIDFK
jgi:hypothetical protein